MVKRRLRLYIFICGSVGRCSLNAFLPTATDRTIRLRLPGPSSESIDHACPIFSQAQSDRQSHPVSAPTRPDHLTIVVPPHYHGHDEKYNYPSVLQHIHIRPMLSEAQAAECLRLAREHASATGCWEKPDFERHVSYATCDFAVESCPALDAYLQDIGFTEQMFGAMSELYGVPVEAFSYLDLFCAHYKARSEDCPDSMDRLEPHRDGSLLSFSVLLNSPDDFDGGGTYVDALRDVQSEAQCLKRGVIYLRQPGDASIHCGKLLHGGDVVTRGERTILVGFVAVEDALQRYGALSKACRDFGRMDMATRRFERQRLMTSDGRKGWMLKNERWLPKGNDMVGRSFLRGYCPAFSSVSRRADPEYQRIRKLEAEDILLRSILLDESERHEYDLFDGDITVLDDIDE